MVIQYKIILRVHYSVLEMSKSAQRLKILSTATPRISGRNGLQPQRSFHHCILSEGRQEDVGQTRPSKKDSHPRTDTEDGIRSGKNVRLSRGVHKKATEKDMVIVVDGRHSELGFYFTYLFF